jgi:PST family polysaccharide transporter
MSLAKRSVQSSTYNIIASIIQTAVQLGRSILLVRLLEPETFGTYRFAASIVVWTASLPQFGMGSALVHRAKESEGEEARRVHFTLALTFNSVWVLMMITLGFFFIEEEARWVFWSLAGTQFITNINQTARLKLVRQVAFRRIALINISTSLITALVAVWLAWKGFGIWSLVSTDIVAAGVLILGYYLYRPVWRPRLGWSSEIARYLLDFGRRNFLSGPLLRTLDRLDDIWTGMFLGDTALGFYSRAYRFAAYPRNVLAQPISSVAASTYAELKYKHKPKRLSQAFFRVNALLVRSGFFLGGLMTLVAPEFIRIVMGVKWLPMLTAFRLMLIFTLLDPLKLTIASLFSAVGQPEKAVRARLIQLAVMVVGLFTLGWRWDIEGVALAVNLMLTVGIVWLLWQARAFVQFSVVRMFAMPTVALVLGIIAGRLAILLPGVLGSPWRTGAVKSLFFCAFYAGVLLFFEREQLWAMARTLRGLYWKHTPEKVGRVEPRGD